MGKARDATRAALPEPLRDAFDELYEEYRILAVKHHGWGFVAPKVIADLVVRGWRKAASAPEAKR